MSRLEKTGKLAGSVVMFSTLLAGCSFDSGEDGRIGDAFASPIIEGIEAIASGNSDLLCAHLNSLDEVDCSNLVAPSGTPEAIEPTSQELASGELFIFSGDGFLLEILRTDLETADGIEYSWSVETFETAELSFPYGGEYLDEQIAQGTSLRLLPGDLDGSKVRSNVDADGLWTATPVKTNSKIEFVFEPSADFDNKVEGIILENCAAHLASLSAESFLPEDPGPAFLKRGQEPGARGVSFIYSEGEPTLFRTMNYPEIVAMSDCETLEVLASFPTVMVDVSISEVSIRGEVDYQSDMTPFGVTRYGFLPRTVQSSFVIPIDILFGVSGPSNEISFGAPVQREPWIIDEPIPDNKFFGGRNSG